MLNNDILEIAKRSGIWDAYPDSYLLECFAEMVIQKYSVSDADIILYTREECARICDSIAEKYEGMGYATLENVADECASVIRNLNQEKS